MRRLVAAAAVSILLAGLPNAAAFAAGTPSAAASAPDSSVQLTPAAQARVTGADLAARPRSSASIPAASQSRLAPATRLLPAAPNGTVQVAVSGPVATVTQRARSLGGRVLATADNVSSVLIPKTRLTALASTSGIESVQAPVKAVTEVAPGPSQGVAASGAKVWQAAGAGGAVEVGVVDAGFTDLAGEIAAGHLPADTTVVNEDCTDDGAPSIDTDQHGTAVAELVHQEAPGAHLVLYCVSDQVGFAAAGTAIEAHHPAIKIVTSSLGFPGDSRGDGTGAQSGANVTAAGVVEKARKAGILWIQSAGNDAEDHWSGTLADADGDGMVDIGGVFNQSAGQFEDDVMFVAPGTASAPSEADIYLQWDQWPTNSSEIALAVTGYQCTTQFANDGTAGDCGAVPISTDADGNPASIVEVQSRGSDPVLDVPVENTAAFDQYWQVQILLGDHHAYPTVRYDLDYEGDVDGPSLLACPSLTSAQTCQIAPQAYRGSIGEPASSPYALAVGAADVGADGTPAGALEQYSSQGPTIDGRVKPDITGWDGVSSYLPDFSTGFYGTSAAAPQVAGAAALLAAANGTLDAAQLQNILEQRANHGAPDNPPNNATGHGLLTLGADAAVAAPTGAKYTAITPRRVLDTRTTTGHHHAPVKGGGTVTVALPGLPAGTTAVAINLTGVGARGSTYLAAYPGGTSWPGTSNLNLSATDSTAAVFAIVSLTAAHSITIRNAAGAVNVVVDELGYFGTGSETGAYTALATPKRVLDTRTTIGAHHGTVGADYGTVSVASGAPAGARAVVVNLTAIGVRTSGYLSAAATCSHTSSSVNYARATRANLAIVQLGARGSFCVTNRGSTANVVVDVVGYLGATGATYHALPSAQRIVDTRTGTGGSAGGHASLPLSRGKTTSFYGSNVGVVPHTATALLTSVVEASTTAASGYLSLFPGVRKPAALSSTLNFTAHRVVANAAIVGVHAGDFSIYNATGDTQTAVDLFGYFG